MQSRSLVLVVLLARASSASAQDKPPILACTKPEGANAQTVVEVQRAWAKHLGEKSHERVLPLSENTGAEFRLLWEAEWVYAYRAGTRTRFYNGDGNEKAVDIAQCTENNFVRTAKVGSKLPNAFGLFDMGGNVAEWCADAWEKDFTETQTTDPHGPPRAPSL